MKKILFFLPILFSTMLFYGQTMDSVNLSNYSELNKYFYTYLEHENEAAAAKIATLYLNKAKKEDFNKVDHIIGHIYLHQVSNFEDALAHLDSVISISKNLKNKKTYPGLAYFYKGGLYHDKKNFNSALNNYLNALEYAEKDKKNYFVTVIKNNIGLIQLERIGKEREALKLFKECEKFYDTIEDKSDYSFDYLALLFSFSENYRKLNKIDSSSYYNKMGIEKAEKYAEEDFKQYFYFAEGINKYLKNDLSEALKILLESENVLLKQEDNTNLIELNYYLGDVYKKLGDNKKSIFYFLKMDSISNVHIDYSVQIRKGIEELIEHYKKENNLAEELVYIKKLIQLDSIYINDYKAISHTINTKYTNKNLIEEKKDLVKKLDASKTTLNNKNYILIVLSIFLFVMWFYFYEKQKKLMKRFDGVMKGVEDISKKDKVIIENEKLDISENIVNAILKNLKNFEEKKMYLKQGLNSQTLAKSLNTNTKYLSKVVNIKKKKTIVAYINNLRVEYAIDRLKTDNKFKFYTISSIADEVGFSNPTSFSQSFYKKTNLKPSFFIKQLIKATNS